MKTSSRRRASVLLAAALALSGCGGDESNVVETRTLGRYCGLARQLEETAAGAGAMPAPGSFGGTAEAVGRLLDQMGPTVEEMEASAPKEVRGDVSRLVDALGKAKGGDVEALRAAKVTESVQRINAFRARSCQASGTSDDG